MAKIIVHDTGVTVISVNNEDFISLTDIARYKITLSPKKMDRYHQCNWFDCKVWALWRYVCS